MLAARGHARFRRFYSAPPTGAPEPHSAGRRFKRWRVRNRKVTINYHDDVIEQLEQEINRLASNLARDFADEVNKSAIPPKYLLAFSIIQHATASLLEDGRLFLFRPASIKEYQSAGLTLNTEDHSEDQSEYHFFETYGYRFTLFLDPFALEGTVLHMDRVSANKTEATESLKSAQNVHMKSSKSDGT